MAESVEHSINTTRVDDLQKPTEKVECTCKFRGSVREVEQHIKESSPST